MDWRSLLLPRCWFHIGSAVAEIDAEHGTLTNFFVAFDEIMKEQKKYFHKPKKHKVEFNKNNKNEFANEMFTNFQQGLT